MLLDESLSLVSWEQSEQHAEELAALKKELQMSKQQVEDLSVENAALKVQNEEMKKQVSGIVELQHGICGQPGPAHAATTVQDAGYNVCSAPPCHAY